LQNGFVSQNVCVRIVYPGWTALGFVFETTTLIRERTRRIQHDAARESARIRLELEARGVLIGPIDLLIAGTAVSRGAILITNNTKEFSRVKGLRLSDWTK
jgi:predicted nucleic acid-binding protein